MTDDNGRDATRISDDALDGIAGGSHRKRNAIRAWGAMERGKDAAAPKPIQETILRDAKGDLLGHLAVFKTS